MKECPACQSCFPDEFNNCPSDGDVLTSSIAGDTVLDGRYQLQRRLGHGGMGIVFQARHILLKTEYAIKVILPDLVGNDPMLVTRFRQEAMVAARIGHRNIVNVTDFGVVGGRMPYLVMDLIRGRSLHEVLAEQGRLSAESSLEIMTAVCAGVGAAHRRGIVHRDLKPLNIMLQEGTALSEGIKVLDFGLAKIKSSELLGSFVAAQTTGLMGSPYYMAPEQWSDEEPDAGSDIYSLGVILFQMLAGDVPFKGPSLPSIMKKHLSDPPPSFAEMGVAVAPLVEAVVHHALAKRRENRLSSVEAFITELRLAVTTSTGAPTRVRIDSEADTMSYLEETLQRIVTPDRLGKPHDSQTLTDSQRRIQDEADRLRGEFEEAQRRADEARMRAEEAARKRAEEEERARREAEAKAARKLAEEQTRKLAEEEEERARREAEVEAARKLAEEEARERAEEERARRKAEVEAARKLAEEQARERAEEEERARREAEVEAARKLAEEQARKLAEEEERARREAEVEAARKLAEEQARKLAEEEERARREAEVEAARKLAEEQARERAEEEERARCQAEEEASRQAEEEKRAAEQARQRAEERETRRRAEETLRIAAEEESARKRATEKVDHLVQGMAEEQFRTGAERSTLPLDLGDAVRQQGGITQATGRENLSAAELRKDALLTEPVRQTAATRESSQTPSGTLASGFGAGVQNRSAVALIFGVVAFFVLVLIGGAVFYAWKVGSTTPQQQTQANSPTPVNKATPPAAFPMSNMAKIEGGAFLMGRTGQPDSDKGYDLSQYPAHPVTVKTFWMDKTEVTNSEYLEFVGKTHRSQPNYWRNGKPPAGQEQWPVTAISLDDAKAFALWRSERDRAKYRLPTEEEWEYAARNGEQATDYPWGGKWLADHANIDSNSLKPVGSYLQGASARWGVLDLIGNAWEWTSSKAAPYPGNRDLDSPIGQFVIRGGAFSDRSSGSDAITATRRSFVAPVEKNPVLGFRLVRDGP